MSCRKVFEVGLAQLRDWIATGRVVAYDEPESGYYAVVMAAPSVSGVELVDRFCREDSALDRVARMLLTDWEYGLRGYDYEVWHIALIPDWAVDVYDDELPC